MPSGYFSVALPCPVIKGKGRSLRLRWLELTSGSGSMSRQVPFNFATGGIPRSAGAPSHSRQRSQPPRSGVALTVCGRMVQWLARRGGE